MGAKKEDDRGPLCIQSSLLLKFSQIFFLPYDFLQPYPQLMSPLLFSFLPFLEAYGFHYLPYSLSLSLLAFAENTVISVARTRTTSNISVIH